MKVAFKLLSGSLFHLDLAAAAKVRRARRLQPRRRPAQRRALLRAGATGGARENTPPQSSAPPTVAREGARHRPRGGEQEGAARRGASWRRAASCVDLCSFACLLFRGRQLLPAPLSLMEHTEGTKRELTHRDGSPSLRLGAHVATWRPAAVGPVLRRARSAAVAAALLRLARRLAWRAVAAGL